MTELAKKEKEKKKGKKKEDSMHKAAKPNFFANWPPPIMDFGSRSQRLQLTKGSVTDR